MVEVNHAEDEKPKQHGKRSNIIRVSRKDEAFILGVSQRTNRNLRERETHMIRSRQCWDSGPELPNAGYCSQFSCSLL